MPGNESNISLKSYVLEAQYWTRYLRSKWLIIFIVGVVGVGLGIGFAIIKKPTYKGSTIFVLAGDSKEGSGLSALAGQLGVDMNSVGDNGAFVGDNIVVLLQSTRIVTGALFMANPGTKELLVNYIGQTMGFFDRWSRNPQLKGAVPFPSTLDSLTPVQDSLVYVMRDYLLNHCLDIDKLDKKLTFYKVTTTANQERIAIDLTKNLVEQAAQMYIETKTKTARQNLAMIQYEADSIKDRLSGVITSSASALDKTYNLNPALQAQRAPIQQGQLQAQVLTVAYGEVLKNLELAKINLQKETPLFQIVDEPMHPLVRQKLSRIKSGIIWGFLAGFLCVLWLMGRQMYRKVMDTK